MARVTRSGRITKPTTKAQKSYPQNKIHVPRRLSRRAPRGSGVTPGPFATSQLIEPKKATDKTEHEGPKSHQTDPSPTPQTTTWPTQPQVSRVYNEIWASSPLSIAFIHRGNLATSMDTETLTLNLIDHIIKPENWHPHLRYNVLSAACFLFASRLVGHTTSPAEIIDAIGVDPQLVLACAGPRAIFDLRARECMAKTLEVSEEDVKKGYRILYKQREGFREVLGGYASRLDSLSSLLRGRGGPATVVMRANLPVRLRGGSMRKALSPQAGLGDPVSYEMDRGIESSVAGEEVMPALTDDVLEGNPLPIRGAENNVSEVDCEEVELDEFELFVLENE